jgi:3-oxoacyl-[acyl-carrier protein] reductase
MTSSCSP